MKIRVRKVSGAPFRKAFVYRVSVDDGVRTLLHAHTFDFIPALGVAARYKEKYPRAEVSLPADVRALVVG